MLPGVGFGIFSEGSSLDRTRVQPSLFISGLENHGSVSVSDYSTRSNGKVRASS